MDCEGSNLDPKFSGLRNGKVATYLPLASLVVVWRKLLSQQESDSFNLLVGMFSTSQNLVRSFSKPLSLALVIWVVKADTRFWLDVLATWPVSTHLKIV